MAYFWPVFALCLGGLVLLLALTAVAGLLWLQRHPLFLARRMRGGEGDPPGNLSYPEDYDRYVAGVTVAKDLPYPSTLPENRFDLYLPKGAAPAHSLPLVLWVHGGSFISGDKAGVANLAVMLAFEGYAVLAPNYAVAPEHPYPAALIQMNELCAHLPAVAKANPAVDISRIVLAGDSAGAQIASQTAAAETNPALAAEMGLTRQLDGRLRGAILCCGPFDLPGIRRAKGLRLRYLLSVFGRAYFGTGRWAGSRAAAQTVTATQVTEAFPPTYITDGNHMSFEIQGRRLGEALRGRGVPVQERYFPPEEGTVEHEYQFLLATGQARLALREMKAFLTHYTK